MALIVSFEEVAGASSRKHGPVEAGWRSFDFHGERILQIDTYGSPDRKRPGKQSQSIQLDRAGAEALLRIMSQTFPGLGQ